MAADNERILKSGEARSVRVETGGGGAAEVVKRFASRSIAGTTLDRARASREHALLGELHRRGVRVPRPIALERQGDAWEVRMEWLDGARALSEFLDERADWPVARERVMRALGELLASLHASGVDHPDLHAGNALVDSRGAVWAIDFHKARRVRSLRSKMLERDLVSLAAGVRERLPPYARARFFHAWLRALPEALRAKLPERRVLAADVETLARDRRVQVVRKRRASRCR